MTAARFAVEFLCRAAERDYLSLDGSARSMAGLAGCREPKFRFDGARLICRIADGRIQAVRIAAVSARDLTRMLP